MPSNYVSNPSGSQPPSAVPGGGAAPILSLPSDGDPANAASVAQAFKATADSVAFVHASSRPDIPVVAASSSGFTAPTYSAFGGTIAPSGAHASDAQRIVIQIQAGGAVGVATFKTSINGGATFGATQTTAASMVCATSGITLAFAGTLTALGTATFRSAFTPLAQWRDAGGNGRALVDHNGYFGGRRFEFREDWIASIGTVSATATPVVNLQRWSASISSGATLAIAEPTVAPSPSTLAIPTASLTTTATSGSTVTLNSANRIVVVQSYSSIVWECDVYITSVLGTWAFQCGLNFNNNDYVLLTFGSSSPTVLCQARAATFAAPDVNSLVTVASLVGTLARLRLEIHGASSPYGTPARAFYFINDALVGSIASNISTAPMPLYFQLTAGAASSASNVLLSGVALVQNRYLSAPPL
jgi:hypothetical protein